MRHTPHGKQANLGTVTLGDGVVLAAAQGDLFRALIEQRIAVRADCTRPKAERDRFKKALKIVASSLYGVTVCQSTSQIPHLSGFSPIVGTFRSRLTAL